jgi:hypothetical protein
VEGTGTIDDPFRITNVTELQAMNDNKSAYYVLANDIDASETAGWNSGNGFVPIGSSSSPFMGYFDGQGYSIYNLFIKRALTDYIGLFGVVNNPDSEFKNLSILDSDFTGKKQVGILCGRLISCKLIDNCVTSGIAKGYIGLGGLIGALNYISPVLLDLDIKHCSSDVTLQGTAPSDYNYVGGLIGQIYLSGRMYIEECKATGDCFPYNTAITVGVSGGGFIGMLEIINSSTECKISRCFATGNVVGYSGNYSQGGGFIGTITPRNSSFYSPLIEDCYATGNVTGMSTDIYISSFIGITHRTGGIVAVRRCYATGNVTRSPSSNYGYFIPFRLPNSSYMYNYFDKETVGGEYDETATPKFTFEMKQKSTFETWDFNNVWWIDEGVDYPLLRTLSPPPLPTTDIGEFVRLKSSIGRTISLKSTTGTEEYEK